MKVYVAGPYTAATKEAQEDNVWRAVRAAAALLLKGHNPFVPHYSHYPHHLLLEEFQTEIAYERWLELDNEWLDLCEALYLIGPSQGANAELIRAASAGKIIWTSMDQVPEIGPKPERIEP